MNIAFLTSLPNPEGDPSVWTWPEDLSQKVQDFLGKREELYRHYPKKVTPDSLNFPYSLDENQKPDIGNGHGGLLYINWTFGMNKLMDLSIDITFHTAPSGPEGVYIQLYDFKIGKTSQYFGFQYAQSKNNEIETKVIWSRWNTRDKSNARVAEGGWIEEAGYENDFVSIRYPYKWNQGTYTVHIYPSEADKIGVWYDMMIYDHSKNYWMKIGGLRFPLDDGQIPFLEDGGGSWCEVFGGVKNSTEISKFYLSFGGIYTCGRTIGAKRVKIKYSDKAPNSNISIDPNGRRIHVIYGGNINRITNPGFYELQKEISRL